MPELGSIRGSLFALTAVAKPLYITGVLVGRSAERERMRGLAQDDKVLPTPESMLSRDNFAELNFS